LRSFHVDAGVAQSPEVILPVLRRQHVEGTLTAVDAVADERQERVVLLPRRVEKGTDMPVLAQHGAREWNGRGG
jgi:hypothetical protein